MLITVAAVRRLYSMKYMLVKLMSPMVISFIGGLLITSIGQKNSFQLHMNLMVSSVATAGFTDGRSQIAGSFTEYTYSTTIAPLSLAPATQFWLGLSNATDPANGTWGLETTSDSNVPQFHAQYFSTAAGPFSQGWNQIVTPLAFNLTNDSATIPEPATLALLGLGLAGLGFSRRRQ